MNKKMSSFAEILFAATPDELERVLKGINAPKTSKQLLMRTTKVEKSGKALSNCEVLKSDESQISDPLITLFGNKALVLKDSGINLENITRIVGHINTSETTFDKLFNKYKEPLALKYEQLVFKDDYGDIDESLALQEFKFFLSRKTENLFLVEKCEVYYKRKKQYYDDNPNGSVSIYLDLKHNSNLKKTEKAEIPKIQKKIAKIFSVKELSSCLADLSKKLLDKVKKYRSSAQYKKAHKADISFIDLSPYDYEKQVAQSLSTMGWDTKVTKASGDQGCDVLATKSRTRIAIQCKYWSKPIGNKAVQEINAAKSFYNAQYAAVVSNQSYTPAAKLLASKLKVVLLHHSQLNKLMEECNSLNKE